MRRDEAKEDPERLKSLLSKLSVLETCTQAVLKEVKAILAAVEPQKKSTLTNGPQSPDKREVSRGKPLFVIPNTKTFQKIVKECLDGRKVVALSTNKHDTINSTDNASESKPRSVKTRKVSSIAKRNGVDSARDDRRRGLYEICTMALNGWYTGLSKSKPTEVLGLLKARYNLLVQLLDAGMVNNHF